MRNVLVIGTGKLAWNLIPALLQRGISVSGVAGRQQEGLARFEAAYHIPVFDLAWVQTRTWEDTLVVLAVSDGAIAGVATALAPALGPGSMVVHASGSVPLAALAPLGADRTGVLYAMQIFTFDSLADFSDLPVFIEGADGVLERLRPLAERLSSRVQVLDSASRARLHLGAVLVCNFPNYLYALAASLVPEAGMGAYDALVYEHVRKVFALGPENTQTGPAIRGDRATVQRHMNMLAEHPEAQQLYRLLSEAINPDLKEKG